MKVKWRSTNRHENDRKVPSLRAPGSLKTGVFLFLFAATLATAAPVNDNFSDRLEISGLTNAVTGSNADATREQGEPDHAGTLGGKSVWWTWIAPTNCVVELDTSGSSLNTLLGVYVGGAISTLSVVASSDDRGDGSITSRVIFPATAGTAYQIAVDGKFGSGGNVMLNLRAGQPPPNDAFANRAEIPPHVTSVNGSNTHASKEPSEPNHADSAGGKSAWWTWTAPTNGTMECDTIGSAFNTVLGVYTGSSVSNLSLVASDDDAGGNGTSRLTFSAVAGTTYQIAVDGDHGIIVLNLRQVLPTVLPPVSIAYKGNWPGFRSGTAFDVQVAGNLAYVSLGNGGLLILDISDPAHPKHVGDLGTLGMGPIVIAGQYAYMGDTGPFGDPSGPRGITVIDISNPAQPVLTGRYSGISISRLAVDGNYAYALSSGGLVVFDLSSKASPIPISTNFFNTFGARGMVVRGDRVYFCGAPAKFWIVNVSDPVTPTLEGFLIIEPGADLKENSDLTVEGSYAFLSRDDKLEVIDIRDPNYPSLVGRLAGVSSGSVYNPLPIAVHETNAYIGVAADLSVVDISNPAAPRLVTKYHTKVSGDVYYAFQGGGIRSIRAIGDRVYMALDYDGLKVINVTNLSNPVLEGQFYTYADVRRVAASDNRVYALNYPVGLQVLDISSQGDPILVGTYPYALDLVRFETFFKTRGAYAYLYDSRQALSVVDFVEPSHPVLSARLMTNEIPLRDISISLDKNTAYVWTSQFFVNPVSFYSNIFRVFDLSNPANPAPFWSCPSQRFEGLNSSFFVKNGFAYSFDGGLKVFDVTNPGNPSRVAYQPFSLVSSSAFLGDDDTAYAIGSELTMYDVRSPFAPRALGSIKTNYAFGVAAWNNHVIATDTSGLEVIDVSHQWNPSVVGRYSGSEFGDVVLAGNQAVVAQGRQGVTILDLGPSFAATPLVSFQPQSQRALPGATARFDVGANGTVPLSYQWRSNGVTIPRATNFVFTLTNVRSNDAGLYSVEISNSVGTNVSFNAELSVDLPPTVAMTRPFDSQVFFGPADIVLAAEAHDSDGDVAQVEFRAGTNTWTIANSPPFTNTLFSVTWSNVSLGTYEVSAVATDNEGATNSSTSLAIIVTNIPVFQLSARTNFVNEATNAQVTVTVRRNTADTAASVGFSTSNMTARAVVQGGVGQYFPTNGVLEFVPGQFTSDVTVRIVDDFVYRPNMMFGFVLTNREPQWELAHPSVATILILEDDLPGTINSLTDTVYTNPPPVDRGGLHVTLFPTNALGKWRFLWELDWRDNGSTVSNLVAGGLYEIEFMPRNGFLAPPPRTNIVIVANTVEPVTAQYIPAASGSQSGALRVTLLPSAVTTGPDRAQWRLLSDADSNWHDSGVVVSNIPGGEQIVLFKENADFETPAPRSLPVVPRTTRSYEVVYLPHAPSSGLGPSVVGSFSILTNGFRLGLPYVFNGQILSDAGYASGFVVKRHTVLTAAHAIFDAAALSYVTNDVWWFYQMHRGEYEPKPERPRGYYVLEGYAAQRATDRTIGMPEGDSSTESRNLDVAALYFYEPPGRGNYGGYLVSSPEGVEWLGARDYMMLLGYPMEGVPEENRGKLHQVGPDWIHFGEKTNMIYSTADFHTYAGNSGGPLCVQTRNTVGDPFFIPAAVYLGGSADTVVRAIDLDVVDLINRAEKTGALGGGNNTGGGVVRITVAEGASIDFGIVQINLGPPAALLAGAGWRIGDEGAYTTDATSELYLGSGGDVLLQFADVPGWYQPTNQTLTVTLGQIKPLEALYTPKPPELGLDSNLRLTLRGPAGFTYTIDYTEELSSNTTWTVWTTNTLTSGNALIDLPRDTSIRQRFYRAVWTPNP
jgi:hypothetical protein